MPENLKRKREWAESLIYKVDPSFKQRWEVYDGILKRLTGSGARWLDAGCGSNIAIDEFQCAFNAGIDSYRHPEVMHTAPNHFVLGTVENLPFRDGSFSLVTLNTVIEHIKNPESVLKEISRVLQPGGHMLVHTTNIYSPVIFTGKLIPENIRNLFFTRLLSARETDVFTAYHKVNSLGAFKRIEDFEIVEFHAVQDLNWANRLVFIGLLAYHLFTRLPGMWRLRTNLIVLLRKTIS
ncbi:class I SAM-dependent methyltransferase [Candidatus Latescibacterota bacterium]